jgi:hypothetical protein
MKLQIFLLGGGIAGSACVMLVCLESLVHVLQQHRVGRVPHVQAGLVQQSHDAVMLLIDQLANHLVGKTTNLKMKKISNAKTH